jgi:PQ loop repeat
VFNPPSYLASLCRAGLYIGYLSAGAYLKSRISQLYKNWKRGDAEGLSIAMFVCAVSGNLFGAFGIIVRLGSMFDIVWQLPWLIGSLGTVAMDALLALQAHRAAVKDRGALEPAAGAARSCSEAVPTPSSRREAHEGMREPLLSAP